MNYHNSNIQNYSNNIVHAGAYSDFGLQAQSLYIFIDTRLINCNLCFYFVLAVNYELIRNVG